MPVSNVGTYGNNYRQRAAVAMGGLGAVRNATKTILVNFLVEFSIEMQRYCGTSPEK